MRVSAISATARKLAIIIWNMVTKGTHYINPAGYLFLDQKRKSGIVKRIQKQMVKFAKERPTKEKEIGLSESCSKSPLIENSNRLTLQDSSLLNKRFIKESFNFN